MRILLIALFLLITATASFCLLCSSHKQLQVGGVAPDFLLPDQNGIVQCLSSLRGKKVALYFYPKDNTPGCTTEACNIRDNFSLLTDAGITVLGISKGSINSKRSFSQKYTLPFTLLSATQDVLDAYGASGSWKRLWMPQRYTFLINEKGIIVAILKDVDVNNHAQQIIDAFKHAQ